MPLSPLKCSRSSSSQGRISPRADLGTRSLSMDQSSASTKRKRESAPKQLGILPLPFLSPNPFPRKLSEKICSTSSQFHGQWQNCSEEKNISQQILHQQDQKSTEQNPYQITLVQQGPGAENQDIQHDSHPDHLLLQQQQKVTNQLQVIEKTLIRNCEKNLTHCPTEQLAQLSESKERRMSKQLSSRAAAELFGLFIRILCSYLDKDKSMQIHALFVKLKNKEIAMKDFSRESSKICGCQLLEQAQIQARTQIQSHSLAKASQVPAGNSSTAQEKLSIGQKKSLGGLCTTQPDTTTSQIPIGNSCIPKKCPIGQKKPIDGCTTPTLARKKQKFSGDSLEQSIEELNDITNGINLTEEEDQLFSASKEDTRASNIFRRVVQEEEERFIIQKGFLQKKIAEITSECGIEGVSSDVEPCLSLCMEERLRGLITKLIQISIQRCDLEKTKHNVVVTSDVRNKILVMNRKSKEEWEKKQAEKLRKHNVDDGDGPCADIDKDEDCSKTHKIRKVDPLVTAAANRAVRDAFGEGDLLSRWQMMAEHARQKRESGIFELSGSILNPQPNFGTKLSNQDAQMRGFSTASLCGRTRKLERKVPRTSCPKFTRIISIRDVISVLEREPQMCRSALLYRLYERECPSIV